MEWHELIEWHLPDAVLYHTHRPVTACGLNGGREWQFDFSKLRLRIVTWTDAPFHSRGKCIEVIKTTIVDLDMQFHRKKLDTVRNTIRKQLEEPGEMEGFELAVLILQVLEDIASAQIELEAELDSSQKTVTEGSLDKRSGWDATAVDSWKVLLTNPHGVDASTIRDTASVYLNFTPAQIREMIPPLPYLRVVHIESVLRPDLAARFDQYRADLRKLLNTCTQANLRTKLAPHTSLPRRALFQLKREDIIEDMLRPRLTFHGTAVRNVASIVQGGFRLPGNRAVDGSVVASPRTGHAFTKGGIYSSHEAHYALMYAEGQEQRTPIGWLPTLRLFVCATVMGRTRTGRRGVRALGASIHGELSQGFDSHFDGSFEYITHREAAILPCYVIHLDWGQQVTQFLIRDNELTEMRSESRKEENLHPKLKTNDMAPGDKKREAERKKAAAMKYFPFGFGTRSGTSFVIEEIGEISDDEEEYGEWQKDKHAFESTIENYNDGGLYKDGVDWDGTRKKILIGSPMDQHQEAVRKKTERPEYYMGDQRKRVDLSRVAC